MGKEELTSNILTNIFLNTKEYETKIGEAGSTLSGGEKQRIAIARAILKDSPIVILDEFTSALDVENERHILQAIDNLVQNKTVMMIIGYVDILCVAL